MAWGIRGPSVDLILQLCQSHIAGDFKNLYCEDEGRVGVVGGHGGIFAGDLILSVGGGDDVGAVEDVDEFDEEESEEQSANEDGEDAAEDVGELGFTVESEELGALEGVEIEEKFL